MVEDLIFRKPPLDGPPNVLVFGEPDETATAAYAVGRIPLPAFMVAGVASATRPPRATASGGIALPAFMASGVARYSSAVSRPLMGKVSANWQIANQIEGGTVSRHQGAVQVRVGRIAAWQKAVPMASGVSQSWEDAVRARAAAAARYQAALQLQTMLQSRYQETIRARRGIAARWQEAERLATAPVGVQHQEASRLQRGVRSRWQEALGVQAGHRGGFGVALQVDVGRLSRWQAAMYPLPGLSVIEPPIEPPCYVPSTTLVFREKQHHATTLVFVCEGHGSTNPGQPPLFIPLLRVYMTTHYMEAVMLPTLERVPLEDVTIEADVGMPHWKLTASGPLGLMDLFPLNSPPKLMRVTVDGLPWVFAISPAGRSRVPGLRRARITGRSVPALAGATSMADQIWLNNAPATAQQVVTEALQFTDVSVDWQIPDWLVPAGAWSFKGKPLAAAVRVAEAVGAVLQSHPTEPTLQFLPRYASLPWEWDSASVTPDVSIASAALAADDYEPDEQPTWEAVYVYGTAQGVGRRVVRGGTAGIILAPQQVDDLITDHVAAVERGRSILGAGGTQALATMSLPILTGGPLPGVLRVNQLLEVVEPAETWRGLVRAVTVRAGPSEVRQAVRVERHFE